MTEDDAQKSVLSDVSRETQQRFVQYSELLQKWQRTINLVAKSSLDQIWSRHFLDSKQIWELSPENPKKWLDLGSGGGFPGLIVAILAQEKAPDCTVTLVESDVRKCGFLREVSRRLQTPVNIMSRRISEVPPQDATVVSARALSSLDALIEYAEPHIAPGGTMLFPKGANYASEVATLPLDWQTKVEAVQSQTHADAVILRILT